MGFSALDYVVLALYLAGITLFGSRFRRSQGSVREYFLGRRHTSWMVIGLSIVATETSTLTLIGVPALAYAAYPRAEEGGSFTYLQVVTGYVLGRVLVAWLFVPAYFRGEMLTAYELLARRFGAPAKRFTASLFLVMRGLAEGVRVYAASLVLAAVVSASVPGWPHLWLWSIALVGVLTLVYTFEGGLAAVIWTDLVQFVVYAGGSLVAAAVMLHDVGGWRAVVVDARAAGKLQAISWSLDPRLPFTFWAGLIGGCFLTMGSHGTDQLIVQRLLACRSAREGQRALIFSGAVVFVQFALFLWIGLMLHAYYAVHPLPPMATADEVFPAFIVRHLPHGLSGLVIAAIFAAAMSTLSGSLSSLASSSVFDFWQPLSGRRLDEAGLLALSRRLTAVWGVGLMGLAVLARRWGPVFTAGLTIASIVYGPMLGAFLLGIAFRAATQTGVIAGVAVSLGAMAWIVVATPLAWTWYVLAGTVVCVSVGLAVSVLAPPRVAHGSAP